MAKAKKQVKLFQVDNVVVKYEHGEASDWAEVVLNFYGSLGSIDIDFYVYRDKEGKVHPETKAHAKKLHGELNTLMHYIIEMQDALENYGEI